MTVAYHDHRLGLNARAFFKINDKSIGEDLVQDTFMKTWKYLVKGGKIDIMKAFLYHVLNHLIVDEYRKHKPASLEVMFEKGFEPSNDDSEHIHTSIDGKASLLLLIKRLPEKYQKIMNMRYVRMLSLKEISLITGQTRNALAVQAHRGLAMLKALYEGKKE